MRLSLKSLHSVWLFRCPLVVTVDLSLSGRNQSREDFAGVQIEVAAGEQRLQRRHLLAVAQLEQLATSPPFCSRVW